MTTRIRKIDGKGRLNLGPKNAGKQVLVTKQDNYSWFIEEVTTSNISETLLSKESSKVVSTNIPQQTNNGMESGLINSIGIGIWNSIKKLFS